MWQVQANFREWARFGRMVGRASAEWPRQQDRLFDRVGVIIEERVRYLYMNSPAPGRSLPVRASGDFGLQTYIEKHTWGVVVGSESDHARFVEVGSAPHPPPIDVIEEWGEEKFGEISRRAARSIQLEIMRRGTPPYRIFQRTMRDPVTRARINVQIQRAINEWAAESGFGGGRA